MITSKKEFFKGLACSHIIAHLNHKSYNKKPQKWFKKTLCLSTKTLHFRFENFGPRLILFEPKL